MIGVGQIEHGEVVGELDEIIRLRNLLRLIGEQARAAALDQTATDTPVDMRAAPEAKVRRFLDLFDARTDTAMLDALAYVKAARAAEIPAALKVSQSRRDAHVWIFFATAVPAVSARRMSTGLLAGAIGLRGRTNLSGIARLSAKQVEGFSASLPRPQLGHGVRRLRLPTSSNSPHWPPSAWLPCPLATASPPTGSANPWTGLEPGCKPTTMW